MKFIVALALVCVGFLLPAWQNKTVAGSDDPWEIGSTDDHDALAHYEFLRTRNPLTNKIPTNIVEREAAFVAQLNARDDQAALHLMSSPDSVLQINPDSTVHHLVTRTGGRTRSLAIDIDNENILVAGTAGGGVWRTSNGGTSWTRTTSDRAPQSTSAVCQDPRQGFHNIWYYGTGETFSSGGYPEYQYDMGVGLFKSIDGAVTWKKLEATTVNRQDQPESPFHFTNAIAVDPTQMQSDVVYAACNSSIMRSSDGGLSWTKVLGDDSYPTTVWSDVVISKTGVVYAALSAGSAAGVWRSVDGINWTLISNSTFGTISGRVRLAISAANPNVLWAYKTGSTTGVYRYSYISGTGSGSGGTWANRSSLVSNLLQTQQGYSMSINVSPTNENELLLGGTSLYYTTDGLSSSAKLSHVGGYSKLYLQQHTWDPIHPDLYLYNNSHPDVHVCVFSPSNTHKIFLGCDGGVFTTGDITFKPSVLWSSVNNNLGAEQFYSVAIDPVGNHDGCVIGGAQDNNSSVGTRDGRPMRWVLGGDGMICEMTSNHKAFLPAYQGGQVYRVAMNPGLDSAQQWVSMHPPGSSSGFITPIRLDPSYDSILYLVGYSSVYRNSNLFGRPYTNDTTTSSSYWRQLGLSSLYTGNTGLSAIGVCKTPHNCIYVGNGNGKVVRIDSVHKSSFVVTDVSDASFPSNGFVNNITVDPENGSNIFVVFSNYEVLSVFHSTDAGASWECIAGNLEENPDGSGAGPACRWLDILHHAGKTAYLLGTTSGVFWTESLSDMSTHWRQIRSIPAVNVDMIRSRSTDGFVAIATHGLGIWSTFFEVGLFDKSLYVGVKPDAPLSDFQLSPNPASDIAHLRGQVEAGAMLQAELYDDRGARVISVMNEMVPSGMVERGIDLGALTNGHYTLQLRVNGRPIHALSLIHNR